MFNDIKCVFIYGDDILIHAETEEEYNKILIEVLERARENNVKFNKNKFQYMLSEKYLGYRFSEGKIQPNNSRITAIETMINQRIKKSCKYFYN